MSNPVADGIADMMDEYNANALLHEGTEFLAIQYMTREEYILMATEIEATTTFEWVFDGSDEEAPCLRLVAKGWINRTVAWVTREYYSTGRSVKSRFVPVALDMDNTAGDEKYFEAVDTVREAKAICEKELGI